MASVEERVGEFYNAAEAMDYDDGDAEIRRLEALEAQRICERREWRDDDGGVSTGRRPEDERGGEG